MHVLLETLNQSRYTSCFPYLSQTYLRPKMDSGLSPACPKGRCRESDATWNLFPDRRRRDRKRWPKACSGLVGVRGPSTAWAESGGSSASPGRRFPQVLARFRGPHDLVPARLVWQATGRRSRQRTVQQDIRLEYTASSLFLWWGPGRSPVVPPVGIQSTSPGAPKELR